MKDRAREYFKNRNLTYQDITEGDILALLIMLNKKTKVACKNNAMSVSSISISRKIKSKFTTNGRLIECYLFMNSHYFTQRECISFNKDGFIGFCGWADERNTTPIIEAFKEWCDVLYHAKLECEVAL